MCDPIQVTLLKTKLRYSQSSPLIRKSSPLPPGSELRFNEILVIQTKTAVYKSGTGTRGRGRRDACVGTWDLGTRDEGLQDIKYGTRGCQIQGRGGRGM